VETVIPLARVLGGVGKRDRACAVGLLLVLVALTPLADASPPDPLWLAGIYDGADFDEAVEAIVSMSGVVRGILLVLAQPIIRVGTVPSDDTALGAAPLSSRFSIRAPPSALPTATT